MKKVRTHEENCWSEDASCFDATNIYKDENFADFEEG